MAVMTEVTLPDEGMYDAVMTKVFGSMQPDDPPAGQLFHVAGQGPNGFRVIAVWESQESYERFAEERLGPAVQELAGRRPEPQFYPVHNWFAPQRAAV